MKILKDMHHGITINGEFLQKKIYLFFWSGEFQKFFFQFGMVLKFHILVQKSLLDTKGVRTTSDSLTSHGAKFLMSESLTDSFFQVIV